MKNNESLDFYYMGIAIQEAYKAYQEDEVPVGAIIVKDNRIICKAYNKKEQLKSPISHAEIIALEKASKILNNWRLLDCTMYVTLEPCCMCAGALVSARIKELVFGLKDYKSGACGSIFNIVQNEKLNHRIKVKEGIRELEVLILMQSFFLKKRKK